MAQTVEQRRARQNKQKAAQRRARGVLPITEHLAMRRARADAVARKAEELGLSVAMLRRRIRLGRLPHPADQAEGGDHGQA